MWYCGTGISKRSNAASIYLLHSCLFYPQICTYHWHMKYSTSGSGINNLWLFTYTPNRSSKLRATSISQTAEASSGGTVPSKAFRAVALDDSVDKSTEP